MLGVLSVDVLLTHGVGHGCSVGRCGLVGLDGCRALETYVAWLRGQRSDDSSLESVNASERSAGGQ